MLMRKIPYGVSSFPLIRRENYLYVDKTRFIREVEKTKTLIHLRPRRFGKSLFLSVLDSYYDVATVDIFDDLFSGLYIHEKPTRNRNNCYMLRFNFSGVQNVREDDLEKGFLNKVNDGVERFINKYELDIELKESNQAADILASLIKGFGKLKLSHKIYILIDEYDHFTNSVLAGDGDEFLTLLKRGGFVRSFYEVIKENMELGIIERIFITGVMSITLDSMTSGFNIDTNITTNKRFVDAMGFTAQEVKDVLKMTFFEEGGEDNSIQLTPSEQVDVFDIFEENYNGYLFSPRNNIKVFNSTLIMYFLKHYLPEKQLPESLVDSNLNQNSMTIENIVSLKNPEQNYGIIKQVIQNKEVGGKLQDFFDIDKGFEEDDIITMLFNIGLLTIKRAGFDTVFEIPNKIIERIYYKYLKELTLKQASYRINTRKQRAALRELGENGKIGALTSLVEEFLTQIANVNLRKFDEKYVKLIYLMLISVTDQFMVYDEFPAGNGFIDILLEKSPISFAKYQVLIELKYIKRKETTPAKIEEKFRDGVKAVEDYLQDDRISQLQKLKKFVIVFSGYEAVKVEELD